RRSASKLQDGRGGPFAAAFFQARLYEKTQLRGRGDERAPRRRHRKSHGQSALHQRSPASGHGARADSAKSGAPGKIFRNDAAKAKNFPGVIATLTRDDIQGFNYKYGATYKDQSIVAVDKVRYVGDPVAAVLADDPAAAEQALELIEVEYEELPKVTSIEEAVAPGAPLVHEAGVARA